MQSCSLAVLTELFSVYHLNLNYSQSVPKTAFYLFKNIEQLNELVIGYNYC